MKTKKQELKSAPLFSKLYQLLSLCQLKTYKVNNRKRKVLENQHEKKHINYPTNWMF
jgi:hypothetical protein